MNIIIGFDFETYIPLGKKTSFLSIRHCAGRLVINSFAEDCDFQFSISVHLQNKFAENNKLYPKYRRKGHCMNLDL